MDQANTTNYKEAFALFDKRGNGRVQIDSLGDLLRACGQNPTLAEISDLEKSIGGDCESSPQIQEYWEEIQWLTQQTSRFRLVLKSPQPRWWFPRPR
jgi:Ca2+-binding EF-hand superfamily protein